MKRDLERLTKGSARGEREIFLRMGNENGKNHGQDSMLRVHVHDTCTRVCTSDADATITIDDST